MTREEQNANKPLLFKIISSVVKIFYRKRKHIGTYNVAENEPCIIVSNHAQMHGPLTTQLYFPRAKYIWTNWEMMNIKEVPKYAYNDFWSNKPKAFKWFWKLVSYLIAPLSAYVFTRADTIPVYRDTRIVATFKKTVQALKDGYNVIIFPECPTPYNNVVNDFQQNFIDIARLYYKSTGKNLKFVPMYLAPKIKTSNIGTAIEYNPNEEASIERNRISSYLKEEITALCLELPKHKIVCYDNVGRKNYKLSK